MVNKTTAQKAIVAALSGMMAIAPAFPALGAINKDRMRDESFAQVNAAAAKKVDDGDEWVRLDGDDRYGTMDEIIEEQYTFTVLGGKLVRDGVKIDFNSDGLTKAMSDGTYYRVIDTAIVVSGENWADALTAASLSGFFRSQNYTESDGTEYYAPIIITKTGSLSPEAKDALKNLKVERVVILGGTASVSENVENQIKALGLQDNNVIRIAGADRTETSVAAFYEMAKRNKPERMDVDVIIASGKTYADALSIGGAAASGSVPIILTNADGELTASAVQALKNSGVEQALIVGGTASVASTVADQLSKINVTFDRIDGANRYETNWNIVREAYRLYDAAVTEEELTSLKGTLVKAVVASGEVYADALVGAPFSAEASDFSYAPIVLVKDGSSTLTYLEDNMNEYWKNKDVRFDQYILGGEASVSAKIHDFLEDIDGVEARA